MDMDLKGYSEEGHADDTPKLAYMEGLRTIHGATASGGGGVLDMPEDSGLGPVKKLEAVIVAIRPGRTYFPGAVQSGVPPACSSGDMKRGYGSPGGDCTVCPFAKRGTKTNQDGSKGTGSACAEQVDALLLADGDAMKGNPPLHLKFPVTSIYYKGNGAKGLAELQQYLTRQKVPVPLWSCRVRISTTLVKGPAAEYRVLTLEPLSLPKDKAEFDALKEKHVEAQDMLAARAEGIKLMAGGGAVQVEEIAEAKTVVAAIEDKSAPMSATDPETVFARMPDPKAARAAWSRMPDDKSKAELVEEFARQVAEDASKKS